MAMSQASQYSKDSSHVQCLRCVTIINEREVKTSVRKEDKRKTGGNGRAERGTIELFIPANIFLETRAILATLKC